MTEVFKINRRKFYHKVRPGLFGGKLTFTQVKNIEYIFNEFERQGLTDSRWLAYMLATVYHETGIVVDGRIHRTMAAVEEMGKGAGRRYGQRVKYDGSRYTQPHIYYGRGHVQNTWWDTYMKLTLAAKRQGKKWNFLENPDLLLQTEPSVWAMFYGMQTGLYTGKRLSNYFNSNKTDWVNARKIINGTDKAHEIAGIAKTFYAALTA